jgi:hypothetical protein
VDQLEGVIECFTNLTGLRLQGAMQDDSVSPKKRHTMQMGGTSSQQKLTTKHKEQARAKRWEAGSVRQTVLDIDNT